MKKRFCEDCGNLLGEKDLFCEKCGAKIKINEDKKDRESKQQYCINCGTLLNDGDLFCQKCGTKVIEIKDNVNLKENEIAKEKKDNKEEKKKNKKLCFVCGKELNDGDIFCEKCGAKVFNIENEILSKKEKVKEEKKEERNKSKSKKICSSCGEELNDSDLFCQKCGTKVLQASSKKDEEKVIIPVDNNEKKSDGDKEENKKKDKDIKYCLKCGEELNDSDLFCQKCGAKVLNNIAKPINIKKNDQKNTNTEEKIEKNKDKDKTNKRLCKNCNEELSDSDKFCQKCGTKVLEVKEEIKETKKEENLRLQNENKEKIVKPKEPKKKSKAVTYGIFLIIILLIVFVTLLYFVLKDKDSSNSDDKKDNDTEEKDDKDKPEDKDKDKDDNNVEKLDDVVLQKFTNGEIIEFYYFKGEYTINKPNSTSSSSGKVSLENKDYEIFETFNRYDSNWKMTGSVTLYRDGDKLKIYDSELNEGLILKLNSNYEKYKFVMIPNGSASYTINDIFGIDVKDGITYKEGGYYTGSLEDIKTSLFYDIRKEEELFKNTGYHSFQYINNRIIQAYYNYGDYKKTILLDLATKKELMSVDTNDEYQCGGMNFTGLGDYYITLGETECVGGASYVDLYTTDLKLVLKNVLSNTINLDGDNLFFRDNNTVHKYDNKGNEINRYKFNKVLDVIGHFFIVVESDSLFIKDEENLSITLGGWKDSYTYHSALSGYYNENQLNNENEKKAGIYLIIETGEDGISSGVEYYFNIDTHEVNKYNLPQIGGYAKPVLYLYPEKDTNVEVTFDNKDNLTTTYPKYKDSWKVLAKSNGDLYDESGKYYYGLYWEEDLNHKVDFTSGFYVEKDEAIEFLEEKLTTLGFNDKERNEFIMYWLPILEKNGKNLVYFELTEERNTYNKLNITPSPDSILRVAIHVKKVDRKVNIKEENLPTFERKGFTAVEWGGVVYN